MPNDFRKRWATPLVMLSGIIALVVLILFSVAAVLLALPPTTSPLVALLLALYVLVMGGLISKYRGQVSPRALGGGFAVGLVALFAAGLVGAQAGIYHEPEEDEEHADPGEDTGGAIPDDASLFVAFDLGFEEAPTTISAGEVTIALDNTGNLPHDVTIDGVGTVVETQGGEQASATVTLEPGEYRFWCDVPGHEPQMNGTFVVE